MTSLRSLQAGSGFLSFNSHAPRLYITADDSTFDPITLSSWRSEGFSVSYIPYSTDLRTYTNKLKSLSEDLSLGEAYALIAYGAAASVALHIHQKPQPHLVALVAYYPDKVIKPNATWPGQLEVVLHLAGDQNWGVSGARKVYRYPETTAGFAEHDLQEHDKVSERLAWTRTLSTVRRGFKVERDLEEVWEEHVALEFINKDAAATISTMVPDPYVNHVPTLTGGIGKRDLLRFYRDFFIPGNPPSLKMRLVSRTMGVDRVVDEMILSFRHTQEIPWMLPGVPPTDKTVEVALVSVVVIRGGKLSHEHIYWDQASVLVQLGLLDPKIVPKSMKEKGMERLPVAGAESAKKVLDEESVPSNELIEEW